MMASKYRDITVVGILRLADNGFGTSLNFFRVGLFSTSVRLPPPRLLGWRI